MFRSEALNAQKQKVHGDVFLTQPIPITTITLLIAAIVTVLMILLFTGSYARSERVAGYLVPSKGLVKIQASQFGVLQNLYVKEGNLVEEGQALVDILIAPNAADGSSFIDRGLAAVQHQYTLIDTQITLEENQLESELAKLSSDQKELTLRIQSLNQQLGIQRKITASAEAAYKDVQEILGKGYISKVESERRHQTWLAQQAQEQLREQELVEANARNEQLQIRLNQVSTESQQRITRLANQKSELDSRKAELEGRQAYTITSPVKGKVVSLSIRNAGRSVQGGQPLLAILPEGSTLEAELFVPSRAAGFVKEGQEVQLLYDAFPYQRFGSHAATLKSVTETILSPTETLAPFEIQEPVYRVVANLKSDQIVTGEQSINLQGGMTLQANIILERRSFMEWLLEPLKSIGASND
ncbi:HlyD family efflux transporter periplasmic adaptor subunit [Kordiimonas laminariae]|uniref:HlyD family efflux transporter periplasmic adaptor subunit n=1 Tax=Kordiimonas laminariae TaxID=2917717 RepID=UPI001FF54C08|nr:HlyD family efflux transporter periplasmic adaptor subunit [Kordiimonas laminariae]